MLNGEGLSNSPREDRDQRLVQRLAAEEAGCRRGWLQKRLNPEEESNLGSQGPALMSLKGLKQGNGNGGWNRILREQEGKYGKRRVRNVINGTTGNRSKESIAERRKQQRMQGAVVSDRENMMG